MSFDKQEVCPDCGTKLDYLGEVPYIDPGGIYYYKCPECHKHYYDDQRGIPSFPTGLREVSETQVETTILI
jgi:tRNA(Ile2) C34 agmatinyltransferase TiaS